MNGARSASVVFQRIVGIESGSHVSVQDDRSQHEHGQNEEAAHAIDAVIAGHCFQRQKREPDRRKHPHKLKMMNMETTKRCPL